MKEIQEIDISIIIPIFNVEDFLGECLDSLLKQSFSGKYEIILINDQSPDNSKAICLRYQKQHPNKIIYLENEQNQGVSVSRNRGLMVARGAYFTFVDPDDLLPLNALSLLHNKAKKFNVDIVKGNYVIFNEYQEKPAPYNCDRDIYLEQPEILSTLLKHEIVRGHTCGKLFLSSKFKNTYFTEGVMMAQDLLWNAEIFSHAEKILISNIDIYRYRHRQTSSTGNKYNSGAYIHWLNSVENCKKFVTTKAQEKSHTILCVKTLQQITKEARRLENPLLKLVLSEINRRIAIWQISLTSLAQQGLLFSKSGWRYLQTILLLQKLKRRVQK